MKKESKVKTVASKISAKFVAALKAEIEAIKAENAALKASPVASPVAKGRKVESAEIAFLAESFKSGITEFPIIKDGAKLSARRVYGIPSRGLAYCSCKGYAFLRLAEGGAFQVVETFLSLRDAESFSLPAEIPAE
jgi:hypothetical protein